MEEKMKKELIMLNKKWSSLDDDDERKTGGLKRGLFAEYYAAMQLMLHGFEVYKTLVDDRGIDYIVRKPEEEKMGVFYEIQVKSVTPSKTGTTNIKIDRDKFDITNKQLYLLAMQWVDGEDPEMYIIPATRWAKPDTIFYDSGEEKDEPQYGLRLYKNRDSLQEYKLENYIDKIS
jgi:hypothetical protein